MESFSVRELSSNDVEALLAFELENRQWFESHIDPRDPRFYSTQGVAEHIDSYLSDFAMGTWHPFVIEDANGAIVGRANLKSIDAAQGSAEVGYRVGQRACGQGLATLALRHLIREAQTHWQLTQLVAYVFAANVGSRRVLERCGFMPDQAAFDNTAERESRFVLPF
jgi:ribosomal-protein-alanine N-acetyltransferase